ncbi:hypothetical protein HS088_TW02G00654 [Tripterygium wilfordii]|uniref:UBA domain-containing protein n=1 Tax=Tripterygium wilfordii TaxID=458696 RepID=A0A7J7DZD4_TRIWF|nr:uncharacterized protein LOC120011574 [Tripterygium wilfordii]XP_038718660.1 uncharacterized protein LOC120011574 [Tripterygium wilfordii]KAF5751639.1 hypothetical protein HS088_TW02G00654 [Tripterygium wilfordii]
MSPASRSKSKDKKVGKDTQKASSKLSSTPNASSGVPASAYNPHLGTFHALETAPTSSASPLHANGRFRNIDETEEPYGSSLGAGAEYDSVSNNDSWSGESEDHKEKPPARQEVIPGADGDKRDKIRQKNEKKHQRQKERRTQELHERCSGYLMSRKLEKLAQQLVSMGFPHERATMALIFNEGKVEQSIAWILEEGEEVDKHRDHNLGGGNLKIDISEELSQIANLEMKYKCTKQEVERAIITCEGDLEKAEEYLRALKQAPSAPMKPEESGDPPTLSNGKVSVAVSQSAVRLQPKPNLLATIQQRRDEKENHVKTAGLVGVSSEPGSKSVQPLKRIQPKLEWAKQQQIAVPTEKRWTTAGSNPSASYSLASSLLVSPPPANAETRYVAVANEYKNIQPGTVREPVVMMQRPQSLNTKQVLATGISSSPPGSAASWHPTNSVEIMKSSGLMPHIPTSRSLSPGNLNSHQLYQQHHYQEQQHFVPSNGPGDLPGASRGNGLWSRTGTSPTLAPASSLGLFSGLGSTGSSGASSPIDWSTPGSMAHFDYTNIDWSLNPGAGLSSQGPSGLWLGTGTMRNNTLLYDSNVSGMAAKMTMRSVPNGNRIPVAGLQDGGASAAEAPASSSREWTSPFEGKDLFSIPRQFVSSPSL